MCLWVLPVVGDLLVRLDRAVVLERAGQLVLRRDVVDLVVGQRQRELLGLVRPTG